MWEFLLEKLRFLYVWVGMVSLHMFVATCLVTLVLFYGRQRAMQRTVRIVTCLAAWLASEKPWVDTPRATNEASD